MAELKQLDIAHQFRQLLQLGNTGSREELAQKLGITPVMVNNYKNKIEEVYKVTINYSRSRGTYFVTENDLDKLPPSYLEII